MKKRPPVDFLPPVKYIQLVCGVDKSTAKRWRRGQSAPPPLLEKVLRGDLGAFHPAWAGWVIRGENIYTPENWEIPLSDLRAFRFMRQQLAIYQVESRSLKNQLEIERTRMEEQPLPAEIPQAFA